MKRLIFLFHWLRQIRNNGLVIWFLPGTIYLILPPQMIFPTIPLWRVNKIDSLFKSAITHLLDRLDRPDRIEHTKYFYECQVYPSCPLQKYLYVIARSPVRKVLKAWTIKKNLLEYEQEHWKLNRAEKPSSVFVCKISTSCVVEARLCIESMLFCLRHAIETPYLLSRSSENNSHQVLIFSLYRHEGDGRNYNSK